MSRSKVRVAGWWSTRWIRIVPGMKLGSAGMHNQVRQWTRGGALASLLDTLFDRGFEAFLSSGHGNVETTTGYGSTSRPNLPGRS